MDINKISLKVSFTLKKYVFYLKKHKRKKKINQ